MLLMKLKSFKYFLASLLIMNFYSPLISEDKIDIWNNKKILQTQLNKKLKTFKKKKN